MGKKKKSTLPWCFYCDREFEDDKILVNHQKAKHFKCHVCHKKLNNAPGLVIHCRNQHKETVTVVPNSVDGRSDPNIDIVGMKGIPDEFFQDDEPAAKDPRLDMPAGPMPVPLQMGYPGAYPGYPPMPGYPGYPSPYGMPPPYGAPYGMPPPYGAPYGMPPYGYPPRPGFPPHGYPGMPPQGYPSHAPGVPLFPIGAAPAAAPAAAAPSAAGGDPAAAAAAPALDANTVLVFSEETISMEERRASIGKWGKAAQGGAANGKEAGEGGGEAAGQEGEEAQ